MKIIRKLTFSTFLVLFPLFSIAQFIVTKKNNGEKQSSYCFANAGLSVPVGFINDSKLSNISASIGPILSIGYHYFYTKRWGMGIIASGSLYKSKTTTPNSTPTPINPYTYYPTGNWQRGIIYISGSYTPVLKKRWSLDIVQGIGVLYIKKPEYTYTYYWGQEKKQDAVTGWNTSYNIGLKSRIIITEKTGLLIGLNYCYALGTISKQEAGFNSLDCELGLLINLKK